ncbi:substrate-binding periplasmic protein [Paraburkholderia phosphatilytica]|uniref:substrate-binding periplasmic protein n=1 Tax=Paraburkholderia phosphatilytica TaxID=2282883 RepID=UPI000E4AA09F|nr:ABC transporter substrate-binding protein [Paraburkholderia phosphatilytica]
MSKHYPAVAYNCATQRPQATMGQHETIRSFFSKFAAGVTLCLAAIGAIGTAHAADVDPGTPLKVVITDLPPYVHKNSNGQLDGIDGKLFDQAARQLGFKYTVTVTNWDGMLAAVQSGRADLAVSDVAWTDARAKTGLFSDPAYYLPQLIAERDGVNIHTVGDLSGHSVGVINGQSYVDALTNVEGVKMRLYPDTVALLSDIAAGRIDVAFMDPLVMVYQKKVRPDLHFNVVPLTAPTMGDVAAHPKWALFGPQMIGWYVRPGAQQLVDKLNGEIHQAWAQGNNAAQIKAVGVTDVTPFLSPGAEWLQTYEKQRRGVDRPADWTPPSSDSAVAKK